MKVKGMISYLKYITLAAVMGSLFIFSGCGDDVEVPTQTIFEIVNADSRTSILAAQLVAAGLDDDLNAAGEFTLFAPSDAAMNNLLNTLGLDNFSTIAPAVVQQVLTYHVVASKQNFAQLSGNLTTLQGEAITVIAAGGTKTLDTGATSNAGFTAQDIQATNGVVHIVDVVLVPPTLGAAIIATLGTVAQPILLGSAFSTLAAAIQKADAGKAPQNTIVGAMVGLENITVFAPVNDVFAAASITVDTYTAAQWDAIIRGHAVPATLSPLTSGDYPTVSGSTVTVATGSPNTVRGTGNANPVPIVAAGLAAPNGVVYPIGGVVLHQ
ncbi:MAG TPA: fasciclin domain-containing protein [Cyclobacteriaceae bacterium]|nr:fasciclin domain-containing protein [Cyclobacteriaceae bacterium]